MNEQEFIRTNSASWNRLAELTARGRSGGLRSLTGDDLRELHGAYMQSTSDLAFAQTHYPGSATVAYLNGLISGAYGLVYASKPRRALRMLRFLAVEYPRLVRANIRPIGLATAVFMLASAIGSALPFASPRLARTLLPRQVIEIADRLRKMPASADRWPAELGPYLSSLIMTNNIQVGFTAFAGGMLLGTLTVYMLAMNGLLLGGLAGYVAMYHFSLSFWSLILPHGVLELPAIWITAGAGLIIARGIIKPGLEPRSASIRRAANYAVRLVLGTLPIFVIAGFVEGFFTPRAIDPWVKLLVAAALGMALAAFLVLGGRGKSTATRPS